MDEQNKHILQPNREYQNGMTISPKSANDVAKFVALGYWAGNDKRAKNRQQIL